MYPAITVPDRSDSPGPGPAGREPEAPEEDASLRERILQVPLFFKLAVANAAVVALSTLLSVSLVLALVGDVGLQSVAGIVGFGAFLAVLAGVGLNTFLIDLALRPLDDLERAARRVEDGDLGARAAVSPVADRNLKRLIHVFNRMLASVEAAHRRSRVLGRHLLAAEERERSSLSRELYDDLAQRLASVLVHFPAARRARAGANPDRGWSDPVLSELRSELAAALDTAREIARRLRPPELDELGLVPAVEAEARILSERSGLDIRVRADGPDPDPGPEGRLALFRILQEALVNAVRHASPSAVEVRIRGRAEVVDGVVVDDGRGFDTTPVPGARDEGPGIQGMRERAAHLGGTVEVSSVKGAGTRVRARIPRPGSR